MKEVFMQNSSDIQEELEGNKSVSELMLYSIDKTARELASEGDFEWSGGYLGNSDLRVELSCSDGAYALSVDNIAENSGGDWLVAVPDDGNSYSVSEVSIDDKGASIATELIPSEDPSVAASLSRVEKALASYKDSRGGNSFGVF